MTTVDKIGILADAAKYDASCSTSGSARKNTQGGLGNGIACGICHAWAADGRCVALLKVLLSNACAYDCAYCVNRRSNDTRRAAFEPDELVQLIMDFYRRNYIEGAFLSSGVIGCPDSTMERLIQVARTLRTREHFNGYLHIKIIPGTSERLVLEAARWADRASVNIELPSSASMARIAPDKKPQAIFGPMKTLAAASGFESRLLATSRPRPELQNSEARLASESSQSLTTRSEPSLEENRALARTQPVDIASYNLGGLPSVMEARKSRPRNPGAAVIPAGQTTQLVIGASPESDATILSLAENLYLAYDVRRVYYSAFIPTGSDPRLPALNQPPLAREHRLYQADWLFRFYGFKANEILDSTHPFLDLNLDPKSCWALRNPALFPVEINSASYLDLLRVPGIGPKSASRIVETRRFGTIRAERLAALGVVMRRARWFITISGKLVATELDKPSPKWTGGIVHERYLLDHPELLRRILVDPAFRHEPSPQLEFQWEY